MLHCWVLPITDIQLQFHWLYQSNFGIVLISKIEFSSLGLRRTVGCTPVIPTSAQRTMAERPSSGRAATERKWFRIICRIPPSACRALAKHSTDLLGHCSMSALGGILQMIVNHALVGISGVESGYIWVQPCNNIKVSPTFNCSLVLELVPEMYGVGNCIVVWEL